MLRLPPELLLNILSLLSKTDQKSFRLGSHACRLIVSPLLFEEVSFDLEKGGIDRLVAISNKVELAQLVRRLVLRRRGSLLKFRNFADWERSVTAGLVSDCPPSVGPGEVEERGMSRQEWVSLDKGSRQCLYFEYAGDCQDIAESARRLALVLSSRTYHESLYPYQLYDDYEESRVVTNFETALDRLPRLTQFAHDPSFITSTSWMMRWRRVQFADPDIAERRSSGEDSGEGSSEDTEIDCLQLLGSLRSIALTKKRLDLVDVHLLSPDLFSTEELCHVGYWGGTFATADGETKNDGCSTWWPQDWHGMGRICQRLEAMTRLLISIERIFTHVSQLKLRLGVDGPTIAKGVSRWLQQSVNLKTVELYYDRPADGDWYAKFKQPLNYQQRCKIRSLAHEGVAMTSLLLASYIRSDSLPKLRKLSLSIDLHGAEFARLLPRAQSLRHLELDNVMLLASQNSWEDMFRLIARSVHLESVKLNALQDYPGGDVRLLLSLLHPAWTASPAATDTYLRYELEIIGFLLRRTNVLPPLCPETYLRCSTQQSLRPPHPTEDAQD